MRRAPLIIALLSLPALASAQPTVGFTNFGQADTNDEVISATNIGNGSGIVVVVIQVGGGNRSYTISDDEGTGNSYGSVVDTGCNSEGDCVQIFRDLSVTTTGDGTLSITINQSNTLSLYDWAVIELEPGVSKTLQDDADEAFDDSVSDTSQFAAASGSIDTSAEVFVVTGCRLSGTAGSETAKMSWTSWEASNGGAIGQYTTSALALTDDRGEMTTGNSRTAVCAISATSQTGSAPAASGGGMLLKGVGE